MNNQPNGDIPVEIVGDSAAIESANHKEELVSVEYSSLHIGPLPHPELLGKYESIIPGAADRIIAMAENEMANRHNMNKKQWNIGLLGVISAFVLGLATISGGVIAICLDHAVPGSIVSLGGLGTIVSTFIYGTNPMKSKKGDENKNTSDK